MLVNFILLNLSVNVHPSLIAHLFQMRNYRSVQLLQYRMTRQCSGYLFPTEENSPGVGPSLNGLKTSKMFKNGDKHGAVEILRGLVEYQNM